MTSSSQQDSYSDFPIYIRRIKSRDYPVSSVNPGVLLETNVSMVQIIQESSHANALLAEKLDLLKET